jgi:RimJ/RimL family protein N-acetyltransferase
MPTVTTSIDTDRLRLRPFAASDLDALANILARTDVMRYLYDEPRTRDEVAAVLPHYAGMNHLTYQGDNLMLAIEERASGTLIGSVNLIWRSQEHAQGEIGYTLHPDHQGRGYASEAARAMLSFGFLDMRLHRISGICDERNQRSRLLLERVGMQQEARLREVEWVKGAWVSHVLYAILRPEWEARQS